MFARFRHTLFHNLKLTSAYPHTHPITHNCVLTTLNSEGGAMVDYIFYSTPTHAATHVKGIMAIRFPFTVSECSVFRYGSVFYVTVTWCHMTHDVIPHVLSPQREAVV